MLHYYGETFKKTLPKKVTFTGYLNFRIIIFCLKYRKKLSLKTFGIRKMKNSTAVTLSTIHGVTIVTKIVYNISRIYFTMCY